MNLFIQKVDERAVGLKPSFNMALNFTQCYCNYSVNKGFEHARNSAIEISLTAK